MAKKKKIGVSGLSKSELREYNRLKQQISRAKRGIKKIAQRLNYGDRKGKVSKPRSKRSELYKDLTAANRELEEFRAKHGIGETPEHKGKKTKRRVKGNTIQYTVGAWMFEKQFTNYINARAFKKIVFVNSGITLNGKKESFATILTTYDEERNNAYISLLAETPWVSIIENEKTSIITIQFLS